MYWVSEKHTLSSTYPPRGGQAGLSPKWLSVKVGGGANGVTEGICVGVGVCVSVGLLGVSF